MSASDRHDPDNHPLLVPEGSGKQFASGEVDVETTARQLPDASGKQFAQRLPATHRDSGKRFASGTARLEQDDDGTVPEGSGKQFASGDAARRRREEGGSVALRTLRMTTAGILALVLVALFGPAAFAASDTPTPGAAYALTNSPAGNEVLVYARAGDGSLTAAGSFATGGAGSGTGLGSQNAVIVSDDHQLLFAVNAGSNSLSSFRVRPRGLELVSTVPSGGTTPTSVAFRRGLLYVLNAGVPNNISGFSVTRDGIMTPLPDSTRPLSADATAPAQVGFDDSGKVLVVTERATNRIETYTVADDGTTTGPQVHASAGPTPFGFAVDKRNTLLVSEAGAGGGASSYRIGADGALESVSSIVMTGQRAACWAIVTKNGRFGYVTNAGTGNISGFAIGQDGAASLLDADGVTAVIGGNPTDVALSHNSRYLYARVAATSSIAVFVIGGDGSLTALPPFTGTPAGLAGLAAY